MHSRHCFLCNSPGHIAHNLPEEHQLRAKGAHFPSEPTCCKSTAIKSNITVTMGMIGFGTLIMLDLDSSIYLQTDNPPASLLQLTAVYEASHKPCRNRLRAVSAVEVHTKEW